MFSVGAFSCKTVTPSGPPAERGGGRERVDYKEVLSPDDFALFARLRDWRKAAAEKEGVPVYAVLTNGQLAAIATKRPGTAAQLREVEGVGEAKAGRYGEAVLRVVGAAAGVVSADGEGAVPPAPPER